AGRFSRKRAGDRRGPGCRTRSPRGSHCVALPGRLRAGAGPRPRARSRGNRAPRWLASWHTRGVSAYTATATVDLAAIPANLRPLGALRHAPILTAVASAACRQGLRPGPNSALERGATWLGPAQLSEALAMREAGITAPILAWLFTPHTTLLQQCIGADIDLSASDVWALEMIADAARNEGRRARVHLEVDTGMSRGGVRLPDFEAVVSAAKTAMAAGAIDVIGVWTHLACADEPGNESTPAQYAEFERALAVVAGAGIEV